LAPQQPTSKRFRDDGDGSDDDSDVDSDDDGDDEIDPEIGETQARYRVKKWVADKLSSRVSGDVFLQDGPCFQVSVRGFETRPGLPDFSLFNIPKRVKIYQTADKLPNGHKMYNFV
jgi:hypothetical protein